MDLLLVALIINIDTGFSEGHVARRLKKAQCGLRIEIAAKIFRFRTFFEPKSTKFGHWSPPNYIKTMPKALPKQSYLQDYQKVRILSKFDEFWVSKWEPKIMQIRFANEVEKTIAFGSDFL